MRNKSYHFIGIGGIGMSALARYLLQQKKSVKGSDIADNNNIKLLKKLGAKIQIGHDAKHLNEKDLVIFGTAISSKNPELVKAKKRNSLLLHRSDLLNELMKGYKSLLVTGTHGKTTTSSLLSYVLIIAKKDPSFIIGGLLQSHKTNGHYGKGDYFVCESDESDGSFLKSSGFGAIVTNVELEHMTYWKNFDALKEGFVKFFSLVDSKKHLFWCYEDPILNSLSQEGISYGFSEKAQIRAFNLRFDCFKSLFDISFHDKVYKDVELNLSGKHNVLNALAVFGLCINLNINETIIREAFISFQGVSRRMEKLKTIQEICFYDDYAHHPTEIRSTLQALREAVKERKIIAIFQPHRYTRVQDLQKEFSQAFLLADEVIVTDIYAASEKPIKNISSENLSDQININSKVNSKHIPDKDLFNYLRSVIKPHDVVISLGAGDISKKMRGFVSDFKEKNKINIALVFGGKSQEHEIAKISAKHIYENLEKSIYKVKLFYISKEGLWHQIANFSEIDNLKTKNRDFEKIISELSSCDVAFPVFHGPNGEDGMIQGFFETLNLPYTGCDYYSCAVAMNKSWTKQLAKNNNIATSSFLEVSSLEWKKDQGLIVDEILAKLKLPLYVKPSHLGSSVGISCVKERKDLKKAIDYALQFDTNLIVEEEVVGDEIHVAVCGNDYIETALPGEILSKGGFSDYEKKYGKEPFKINVPSKLSKEKLNEVQAIAKELYKIINGSGFARIDFFVDDNKKFYFNEINPIPGFTYASLFLRMWEASNIERKRIIDRFIILAMHKKRKLKKLQMAHK